MPGRNGPVFAVLLAFLVAASASGAWPRGIRRRSPGQPRTAGTTCPATSEEENAALVRSYLEEAYNGHNPAMADEHLADDFVRHSVEIRIGIRGHGNADDVARVKEWLTAFPDLHISIEKLIAADNTVVAWLIWSGTHEGPLPHWDAPGDGAGDGAGVDHHLPRGVRPDRGELDRPGQPDDAAPAGDHHR